MDNSGLLALICAVLWGNTFVKLLLLLINTGVVTLNLALRIAGILKEISWLLVLTLLLTLTWAEKNLLFSFTVLILTWIRIFTLLFDLMLMACNVANNEAIWLATGERTLLTEGRMAILLLNRPLANVVLATWMSGTIFFVIGEQILLCLGGVITFGVFFCGALCAGWRLAVMKWSITVLTNAQLMAMTLLITLA